MEAIARYISEDGSRVAATIASLQRWGEGIRKQAVVRLRKKVSNLAPEKERAIEALTQSLVENLFSNPIKELQRHASDRDVAELVHATRTLFHFEA